VFAVFLVEHLALDEVGVADVWKVEVAVQCAAGPHTARFDAPELARRENHEIGVFAITEAQRDVLIKGAGWF